MIIPSALRKLLASRPALEKAINNTGWLMVDRMIRLGVGLFVGVWVARYLGPEGFGLLNYALALTGLFLVFGSLGLQEITVRELVRSPAEAGEILGSTVVMQLIASVLAYFSSLLAVWWLRPDDPLAWLVTSLVGLIILFKVADFSIYWFESTVSSKYVVWVQNAVFAVLSLSRIALILWQAPVQVFAALLMLEAAATAMALVWIFRRWGPKCRFTWARGRMLALLRDGWPALLSGLAVIVYMRIDQVMLGHFIGDDAVGIYSAAVRITEVWYFIPIALVASVSPSLLTLHREDRARFWRRFQGLLDVLVVIALVVAGMMTLGARPLIVAVFGPDYAEAADVLLIHTWTAIFSFLGIAAGKWFLAENLLVLGLSRTLTGAVLNVALNAVLIPKYGVQGAAWATLLSQATVVLLMDGLQRRTREVFYTKIRALNLFRIAAQAWSSLRRSAPEE